MRRWPSVLFLFCVSQLLPLADASHFRYGLLYFAPIDSQFNTIRFTFRLAFRRSYSYSYHCDQSIISSGSLRGSGDSWRAVCVNYAGYNYQCNSRTIGDTGFRCTDYSSVEDWTMGENNFTYSFPSVHDEWWVSYTSCCWISLSRYSSGSWLVSAKVNLTRRADNGRINSSPLSRSPAILRWQEGCPQSLRIPVEDPDGDLTNCRWATHSESYRYPDSFPYGALNERTCVLSYNGTRGTVGTYAVALTLEDYPAGTTDFNSVRPFSSVGLQFLVIISSQSGSCNDIPVFTASTPNDGECSEVQIGSAYIAVIEVTLTDFSKHISEIVTSSPPGMQLSSLRYSGGVYYKNVTWYPSQYQVGQQLFCFKAVDSANMESEYRCVTILVGLSSTPRVVMGSQTPRNPVSKIGPGFTWWSIQFDRVIKKPRASSFIRLVSLPSGHAVYKVDTLSSYVRISSDHLTLQFAIPNAALSMNGSYAVLIDQGAVVGQGCSYDGPPTPGIPSSGFWRFVTYGFCPFGYYLAPPGFSTCVDINECGYLSRSKRSQNYYWWSYSLSFTPTSSTESTGSSISEMSPTTTSSFYMPFSVQSPTIAPTLSSSQVPFSDLRPETCSSHLYMNNLYHYQYIQSPDYPNMYPENKNCTWLIEVPAGRVCLYVYQFNLEFGGNNCTTDYLDIRDGSTSSSPLITKACGSVYYMHICSTSKFLFVHFHSNGYLRMPGFYAMTFTSNSYHPNFIPGHSAVSNSALCLASQTLSAAITATPSTSTAMNSSGVPFSILYQAITSTSFEPSSIYRTSSAIAPSLSSSQVSFSVLYPGSCSLHLILNNSSLNSYKYFQSPNYPNSYPNREDCTWLIEARPGYFVRLYIDPFNLEYGTSSCPWDYLEIRDGNSPSSPLIKKACGSLAYLDVYSTGRFLFLQFRSDSIIGMPGFAARAHNVKTRSSNSIPSQRFCVLSQMQFPSVSGTATITSTSFEPSSIYRTSSAIAPSLSSSQVPFSVLYPDISPTSTLSFPPPSAWPSGLRLVGGIWNGEGRVEIFYNGAWGTICDDLWDFNDARVVCRSLGYPDAISAPHSAYFGQGTGDIWLDNVQCWGHESSIQMCSHNGWGAHNCGHSEDASVICSSITSISFGSSSLYRTSSDIVPTASSSYVPFSILYSGSCSANINFNYFSWYYSYYFQSPNYPNCYPNNKDCTWLIESRPGYFVRLYIYTFNLQYGSSSCPWDYLEIRDGNYPSSPLITKACGSLAYFNIYSTGRFLFVRFHSDGITGMPGFAAWARSVNTRYSNWVPSQQLSMSNSAFCVSSQTHLVASTSFSQSPSLHIISATSSSKSTSKSMSLSAALQISPTTSSSMSSSQYVQFSSYAPPIPSDFQLDLPSNCDQICRNTPGSYSCSCVTGYQLASDGRSCTDINECTIKNGGCSHYCYNIPGSFYCRCPEGTTMAENNLTCVEPGVSVSCGENNMTVSLDKQTFPFFTVNNLHLRYSSCRATQNSTHLIISTPLNGCGTQVNETQDDLIFWNEIQVDAVVIDYVITRTHDINIPFYCSYSRRDRITLSFTPGNVYFGVESGYGNFTFKMNFFESSSYATPYSEYPIPVDLNDDVYMQYAVESSADLVIMAENCRATKGPSFYSWPQYQIIQNGCPRDTTLVYNYDPNRNYQQFKMKAFRFFNDYNTVYFHCEVLACHRYTPNSRCRNSCLNSKKRKRREVTRDDLGQEESTTKHILTGGPLVVKKTETGDTGQSKNAALIGGVAGASGFGLIAVIALAVLFVKYRVTRRFMNRNKVGDIYTTQEEQISRKNAYIQEDDMIEKEDSF